jgi:hypothetical protein
MKPDALKEVTGRFWGNAADQVRTTRLPGAGAGGTAPNDRSGMHRITGVDPGIRGTKQLPAATD